MSDVDDALAATDRIGSYKQPTVGEWAAIRLAEEVRTLRARVAELERVPCTCDYAGMEGERHKDFCEIEGGPHVECRYEIGMLEASRAELETIAVAARDYMACHVEDGSIARAGSPFARLAEAIGSRIEVS